MGGNPNITVGTMLLAGRLSQEIESLGIDKTVRIGVFGRNQRRGGAAPSCSDLDSRCIDSGNAVKHEQI